LEKAVEACCVECVAQKARKEAEAKIREKAEKWRITEEKKRRKNGWSIFNDYRTRY